MMQIATKSKATVDSFNFLKDNPTQTFTIREVADALGVTSAKVTGGLVSLAKKGVVKKMDVERDDKPYKGFQFAEDVEFVMETAKQISDKGVQLLQFMQKNPDADFTAPDIAEEMGVASIAINGVANGLIKRNLMAREVVEFEMPDGEVREIKVLKLTDAGVNYKF